MPLFRGPFATAVRCPSGYAGAEVQNPLATVVIGGLLTATALTLLVLPTFAAKAVKHRKAEGIED